MDGESLFRLISNPSASESAKAVYKAEIWNRAQELVEGLPSDSGVQPRPDTAGPCRYPGHWRWLSIHGTVVCKTCHPPAHESLVKEWLSPLQDVHHG